MQRIGTADVGLGLGDDSRDDAQRSERARGARTLNPGVVVAAGLAAALLAGAATPTFDLLPAMALAALLFTVVFCLGAWLAGFAGVVGGPILSVYPGLDQEMLPLALVVVILGGSGSLVGSLVGSFVVGFLYNFGQAMFPELAYVVLFLPMLIVLVLRPQGLFGRPTA